MTTTLPQRHPADGWFTPGAAELADLRAIVEVTTDPADHPTADRLEQGIPVYGARLRSALAAGRRRDVQAELARTLASGPGVVVVSGAFQDAGVVDAATAAFEGLIAEQRSRGAAAGDHFAAPGANDRLWRALDKLALRAPEVFADYYANDILALVSEAWLGPGYQVTSQVNVVNPGGAAQVPHRDYHLGFMSGEQAAGFPAHVHLLSPALTLQGAVAHCDMPVETGPTRYLPHSQKYPAGYLAAEQPEFTAYVAEHCVQLPLHTGDAAFFNPAVLHGAGTNRTPDVRRMANLLQISSAFGRAMETVDRAAIVRALFPVLAARRAAGAAEAELRTVLAASAEGYAFPTDLDLDQPIDGRAPQTQAELVWQALTEEWAPDRLDAALTEQAARRAAVR